MNPEMQQIPSVEQAPSVKKLEAQGVLRSTNTIVPPEGTMILRAQTKLKKMAAIGVASVVGVTGMAASTEAQAGSNQQNWATFGKVAAVGGALYVANKVFNENRTERQVSLEVFVSDSAKQAMQQLGFSYNEGSGVIFNQTTGQMLNLKDPRFLDKGVMVDRSTNGKIQLTYHSLEVNGRQMRRDTFVSKEANGAFRVEIAVPPNYPR